MPGIIFPVSISFDPDTEGSDYRPRPASDRGLPYKDRGVLGDWSPNGGKPYADADGIKSELQFGSNVYGIDEADARRGYVKPSIENDPAYAFDNYKERWSEPMRSDNDEGGQNVEADWRFRGKNRESKGFLARPRIPTER